MANIATISLNAGLLTPLIDARSDIAKYSSGCRICQNVIPLIYGPNTRRPGTKLIAEVKDSSVKSRVVSFIFSSTIAYRLEFANQVIRVYFEETFITSVDSPYLEADLYQLQFEQSADVMWITHPSYQQRNLSRTTVTTFSLDVIEYNNGPFIKRNDLANDDDITIGVTGFSVATASTGGGVGTDNFTIEGSDNDDAIAIGALFPANHRYYVTDSTGNDAAYTVNATTPTVVSGTTVTIFANEAISNGTNDGQIMVDGGEVTLTASDSVFVTGDSGHTGTLFKITHKRLKKSIVGSATGTEIIGNAVDAKGAWTLTSKGNWGGEFDIERLADGTTWEVFRTYASTLANGQGDFNAQKSHVEEDDGVRYRINARVTGGTLSVVFEVDESTQDSIFRITATATTSSATATAIIAAPDNTATKRWAEGSWSEVRGYPAAVTFFGERIVFGFSNLDQQDIWLSQIGEFEDFDAGTKDSDAFTITLPTANTGRWLGSLEVLAAGTTGEEWRIRSTTLDQALTPTNWDIKEQTAHGSTDIQAIKVNEAILFVDSVARKIREFTFVDERQKYVAPDLTALAENITLGGITSIAVQKNPNSIIWLTLADSPYLISMTYEREQDVVAFAQHPLGGDGIAESVCITPSTSEDVITIIGQWIIGGQTKRYICDMQPRDWGSTTSAANSFFVDAGIVQLGGGTTIGNLGHLEGREVSVLVDGAVQASQTVSGAEITITEAGDRVVVGLGYEWQVSPMRPDVTSQAGTTYGSLLVTPEIVLSLFASGGVSYGNGVTRTLIDPRTSEDYSSPPDLFTGTTDAQPFDGGFTKDVNIVISGSDPLPATVRAIILRIDKVSR